MEKDPNAPSGSGTSGITTCRTTKQQVNCNFGDAGFKHSLMELKRLNLVNGKFSYKLKLVAELAPNGKIHNIVLFGDRGDPANMLDWPGSVIDVIKVWDSEAGQENNIKEIGDQLGLLRGDSSDDIGRPKVDILDHVAITCLAQQSDQTTSVQCRFDPRS